MIANEITTGFGRTGRWFGFQHYGLAPDIVAVGKAMVNGYPVSAIALRDPIPAELDATGFHYAQSHQDDPLGCAIAAEVIHTLREEGLVERSARMGEELKAMLTELAEQHDFIREVRGRGLMLAIQFTEPLHSARVEKLFHELLAEGYLVGYKPASPLFRLLPPLNLSEQDSTSFVQTLSRRLIAES